MADNEKQHDEQTDLLIGRHPVLEALQSDRDIHKLFVQEGLEGGRIDQIEQAAHRRNAEIRYVPKSKLDKMSRNGVHQGVIVTVAARDYASLDDIFDLAEARSQAPFIVILDELEDPHNLGSILRTADATGAHGVIIPKHRAVGLTYTVAKASAGAIEHVPVARVTNIVDTIKDLQERGVWVFGADGDGEDYRQWNAKGPIAVVIGNEGKGMSRLVKESVDGIVSIPMVGEISSLNASVAAGIMMYEVYRQNQQI